MRTINTDKLIMQMSGKAGVQYGTQLKALAEGELLSEVTIGNFTIDYKNHFDVNTASGTRNDIVCRFKYNNLDVQVGDVEIENFLGQDHRLHGIQLCGKAGHVDMCLWFGDTNSPTASDLLDKNDEKGLSLKTTISGMDIGYLYNDDSAAAAPTSSISVGIGSMIPGIQDFTAHRSLTTSSNDWGIEAEFSGVNLIYKDIGGIARTKVTTDVPFNNNGVNNVTLEYKDDGSNKTYSAFYDFEKQSY